MTPNNVLRLLLVDDDKDDQEIFHIALQDLKDGFDCKYANDGNEALEYLKDPNTVLPQCIFIDMNMPRMNGIQCLAEIKKDPKLAAIPSYMYSTSADQKSIEAARELGAMDFIIKPASISELTEILRNVFKNLSLREYAE